MAFVVPSERGGATARGDAIWFAGSGPVGQTVNIAAFISGQVLRTTT
jgi:hypothetical protein